MKNAYKNKYQILYNKLDNILLIFFVSDNYIFLGIHFKFMKKDMIFIQLMR